MTLSNYHTHTTYCDGKSTPEEVILEAIKRGLSEIGFSGHSPLPGEDWSMTEKGAKEYIEVLKELQKTYKKQIKVYIGVEQDIVSTTSTQPYDYVIGSVHAVTQDGKYHSVDMSAQELRRAIEECYGGDIYSLCEDYYANMAELYQKTRCDIVGHFDIVTKYIDSVPFSTEHPRYVAARDKALDSLLAAPVVFEVNTGAISRGVRSTPYPDDRILAKIIEAGKPLIVSSDSHAAKTVDFLLREQTERLTKMGATVFTSMEQILSYTRGR